MSLEDFIISMYLFIDEYYQNIVKTTKLRKRGYEPAFTDSEAITIQLVGEYLGLNQDKQIWHYFKDNWQVWFPKLGSYPNFAKQCANLWKVDELILSNCQTAQGQDNIYFVDGFPIPVCKYARASRNKSFKETASFSYCASKKEKYFGFEGHIIINFDGMISNQAFASASIDERDVLPTIVDNIKGLLGADKGFIRPELKESLAYEGIDLQHPLRKNMVDDRNPKYIKLLMKYRRKVETVISQLTERFNIQKVLAKDLWHFTHRFTRKILAHTACVILNKRLGNSPLQLELLVKS